MFLDKRSKDDTYLQTQKSDINSSCSESGALIALLAKGAQDYWLNGVKYKTYHELVLSEGYQLVYGPIEHVIKYSFDRKTLTITLSNAIYDFINLLDLYVNNSSDNISKTFKNLTIKVDNDVFDEFHSWEQLVIAAAFNGKRKVSDFTCCGEHVCTIPLAVAPFHENNYVKSKFIVITITFLEEVVKPTEIGLFGKKYYLQDVYNYKYNKQQPHDFITYQSRQYVQKNNNIGLNCYKLNWLHPVTHIYFWGFDKTKLLNVKLSLNGHYFYNGPLVPLEHEKARRGFDHIETCIIFLCEDEYDKAPMSSINFSRIEFASLTLEMENNMTDLENLHIAAINVAGVKYEYGKYALSFSSF